MSSNKCDEDNADNSPSITTIMHSRKQPSSQPISISMPVMSSEETTYDIDDDDDMNSNNDRESQTLLPLHHSSTDDESPSKERSTAGGGGPSQATKIGTALFYAVSSLGVIFANKIVLSTYAFPSVQTLAFLQFASTTLALKVASMLGYIKLLPISVRGVKSILPLSTCYLLNILTGLSATQNLSLPMMVLLRRASILMTMVSSLYAFYVGCFPIESIVLYFNSVFLSHYSQLLEKWMLNSQPSKTVQLSVGLMLGVS